MIFRRPIQLIFLVAALLLSGCGSKFDDIAGLYEGDFSKIENGTTQSLRVTTEISEANWHHGNFNITVYERDTKNPVLMMTVEKRGVISKLFFRSSILAGASEVEIENRGGSCAVPVADKDQPNAPSRMIFCAQSDVISFFSSDGTGKYRVLLYMSKNTPLKEDPLIKDGLYSLDDLFRHVATDNYETRLATEKLYQAQEQVKITRSYLFPSLSYGTAKMLANPPTEGFWSTRGQVLPIVYPAGWLSVRGSSEAYASNVSGYQNGIIAMAGSLFPFIFPTYWLALDRHKELYEAEVIGFQALIANQMTTVQDIYHEILRDRSALKRMQEMLTSLKIRRNVFEILFKNGIGTQLDLDEMDEFIRESEQDIARIERSVTTQYALLSVGIGLSPRNGVKGLIDPAPLGELNPIDTKDLWAEAKAGSLEIRQMLYLEQAAAKQSKEEYFSFINPSEWIGFSESIFHRIKISKSAVEEVKIRREKTEREVEDKVTELAAAYNFLLSERVKVQENLLRKQKILDQISAQYSSGAGGITLMHLRTAYERLLKGRLDQDNIENELAAVIGKMNRLMWRGAYVNVLQSEVPRTMW